jgi:hypothetical protein
MDSFLAFIENGALSTFIRETPTVFVFPAILTLHTIGMGVVAGGSIAIDLRILGFAPNADVPGKIKLIAATSLSMWIAVLICGRLLTFFRPPFFHSG